MKRLFWQAIVLFYPIHNLSSFLTGRQPLGTESRHAHENSYLSPGTGTTSLQKQGYLVGPRKGKLSSYECLAGSTQEADHKRRGLTKSFPH